ncbi:MAG: deoxyribonuclease IV [Eubacteriales bacterium]|nr:deoxyribonuclease IV [Lachnospiraceae bacterium]MDO5127667.1 deoxyribonuclease IV [Eubacteriales bacterium]
MLKIGSHVSMGGKEMMLGSVKEALSYDANTFMLYTGAPQNTVRKDISMLRIDEAWELMRANNITEFVVHAPYIINLANTVKPETYQLAVDFLRFEIERTEAMGSDVLILHPGSHVGAGVESGVDCIAKGLNEVLTKETKVKIALETMAGKGSEVGRSFEELAMIYDKVNYNDKLRVCFDTCHTNDAGYDIVNDFDGVMTQFDKVLGKNQIAVFHINDSKNVKGAAKDRHENLGLGEIGFDALHRIVMHKDFENIPKILETPYVKKASNDKVSYPPYKVEIDMLRSGCYDANRILELANQ